MILFKKIIAPTGEAPFTRATKEKIWTLLSQGKKPSQMFKEDNVPIEDTKLVIDEIEKLEQEVLSKVRGTWELTPEVKDAEGNVTTPATYFKVTTRTALTDSMTFVNVLKVPFMDALITYYPTYNCEKSNFLVALPDSIVEPL